MVLTPSKITRRYYMVHTGLMTYYSKSFPGLFKNFKTIFKESVSTGMISHFFDNNSKKAIPVSANNVIQPKDRNPGHLKTALLILSERLHYCECASLSIMSSSNVLKRWRTHKVWNFKQEWT